MLRHVWSNYERHAFGKDQLKPVTGRGVDSLKEVTTCFGFAQLRATLIPWVSIVQISFASSVKSGTKQPVETKMMSCSNHACTLQRRHEKM